MSKENIKKQSDDAAKKINSLLKEKQEIEGELDNISQAKALLSVNQENVNNILYIGYYPGNEKAIKLNREMVESCLESLIQTHSDRLAKINDDLIYMVRIIKD